MTKPRVVLGMPRYSDAASFGAVKALMFPTAGACEIVDTISPCTSLLDHCFNQIWCHALNRRDELGATHFAMIHADIAPTIGWLDVLAEELAATAADMLSVVVPIKDSCGLTSTALNTGDLWLPRRLTMSEVMKLPETFGAADAGHPLLLNTGLWICDLRKPWVNDVCFDSMKRIVTTPDGRRHAQCVSEDWFFSDQLNQRGCRLFATRKVALVHHGGRHFVNDRSWGLWETDELYEKAHGCPNPSLGGQNACEVPSGGELPAGRPVAVAAL